MAEQGTAGWEKRRAEWLEYVERTLSVVKSGRAIPVGPSNEPLAAPHDTASSEAPAKILIAAPHPDDECLTGALALRLKREAGAQIVNCAVTLGSKTERRKARLEELRSACRILDFELIVIQEMGLDRVTPEVRREQPEEWRAKVRALREIFNREKPDAVVAPHAEDFNRTHIGTHHLVVEAMGEHLETANRGPAMLIESEYWHEMAAPNLMVGVSAGDVAIQVMAAAEHGGEVSRNPYHLLLPARMMDNVRRGSEVVGGQGAPPAQPVDFAELYRVSFMKGSKRIEARRGGRIASPGKRIDFAWLWSEFRPENL